MNRKIPAWLVVALIALCVGPFVALTLKHPPAQAAPPPIAAPAAAPQVVLVPWVPGLLPDMPFMPAPRFLPDIPPIVKSGHAVLADGSTDTGSVLSGGAIFETHITPASNSYPNSVWTIQAGIQTGATTRTLQRLIYVDSDADGDFSDETAVSALTQDLFTNVGDLTPGAVYVGSIAALSTCAWNLTFDDDTSYSEVIVYEHQD